MANNFGRWRNEARLRSTTLGGYQSKERLWVRDVCEAMNQWAIASSYTEAPLPLHQTAAYVPDGGA